MYSYSREELKIEYWVRDQYGSLLSRHPENALSEARRHSLMAQGAIFEVVLGSREGEEVIVQEVEI